jgi:type I restriction-modification system DNA methylase subunit
MLTGELRSQIDRIWDAFWSGGISNPLEVIEQITYLLFIRRLDELHTLEENRANTTKKPMERRIFPAGKDPKGTPYDDLRWSRFQHFEPKAMYEVVGEHVFPFLKTLGGEGSTYSAHLDGARFTIPTPALLAKVVDLTDKVPMQDRDTKGDLYEYMLGKIATAGQNGQFRTPRHVIRLMVEFTAPTPDRRDLRPGQRHLRVPGGGRRVPPRPPAPAALPRRQAEEALPRADVPRVRLRPHHAPHRQHEHAPAWGGEPSGGVPRLARPGPHR